MKFKSNLLAQASGSLAGSTYSHNRFGMYIRNRSTPVNPQSSRQNAVRNLMSDLVVAWNSTLTDAQRDAWRQYAANVPVTNSFGDPIHLTGFNHYIRSNIARMQAGLTRVDAGPTVYTLAQSDASFDIAVSAATGKITVTFDDTMDWCDEDGGAILVSVGLPQNAGINFFGGPWRFADSIDGSATTPPSSTEDIDEPWEVAQNNIQWAKARICRADGRLSTPTIVHATVGA